MTADLDRYARLLPKKWIASNPNWQTFLGAIGAEDSALKAQIQNGREQLFVSTAVGTYLEALAEALQVYRSAAEWLSDDNFRLVVPILASRKKQRRSTIYELAETIYPPEAVFAIATTPLTPTYNVEHGDTFSFWLPEIGSQTRTFCAEDVQTSGAATTDEVLTFLNKFTGISAQVTTDLDGEAQRISLCTLAHGPSAKLMVHSTSTSVGTGKLEFEVDRLLGLSDSEHRFAVWEVVPGQIIIEIPRTSGFFVNLSRSAGFCISEGAAAAEDYGSFWASGAGAGEYYLSGADTTTAGGVPLTAGSSVKLLQVSDASEFSLTGGFLTFNFGLNDEEGPVPFLGVANPHTLRLDPSYNFVLDHEVGTTVSEVAATSESVFRVEGEVASPFINKLSVGFTTVQDWIKSLVAEGFVITFDSFEPEYTYLTSNPVVEEDSQ